MCILFETKKNIEEMQVGNNLLKEIKCLLHDTIQQY